MKRFVKSKLLLVLIGAIMYLSIPAYAVATVGLSSSAWTETDTSLDANTTTISNNNNGSLSFSYNSNDGSNGARWQFDSIAGATETFEYNWFYQYNHAWFYPTATVIAYADGPDGEQTVTIYSIGSDVTGWGEHSGSGASSLSLHSGYHYGFRVFASNFDANTMTRGILIIGTTATTAAPTVNSINPSLGSTTGGTLVTITGTNLDTAIAVKFGDNAATIVSDSANQITATSPAGSSGTVDVTVTTIGGTSSTASADQFTYIVMPAVTSINPNSGPTAGGTAVTITGTNLDNATAVKFGNNTATIISDTANQITVTAPAGNSGTVDVRVTTTDGTSDASSADQFTYAAAPVVTLINPIAGPTAGGTTVTITGTNLDSATAVKFGNNTATIVSDTSTQITATSPAGSSGTVDVTVTTIGGTSSIVNADQFAYIAAPVVTSINRIVGSIAGGMAVTITGANLDNATAVKFGNNAATIVSDSANQITATSPAGNSGTVDVTVTTIGGTSSTVRADQFTYVTAPVVMSINPRSGSATGGTAVTIVGTNLDNSTAVRFGNNEATIISGGSNQITVTSPAGSRGTIDVTVTTIGGTSSTASVDQFTYDAAPVAISTNPTPVPTVGGIAVTITGTNGDGIIAVAPEIDNKTVSAAVIPAMLTEAFNLSTANGSGIKTAVIDLSKEAGIIAYKIELPSNALSSGDMTKQIEIKTDEASIMLPSNMLSLNSTMGTAAVTIGVAAVDRTILSPALQPQIGNRPVIELNLNIDGKAAAWNNPSAPVTVSIPYTPTAQELSNLNNLQVLYIDDKGKATVVSTAKYDDKTGLLTFSTIHFSIYAVAYIEMPTLSDDTSLSGLTASSGSFIETFSTLTTAFTQNVSNEVSSVTVIPIVNESHATVTVAGIAAASGQASGAIALSVGANPISVVVTAQNGTTKTYTITITRAALVPEVSNTHDITASKIDANGNASITITPQIDITTSTLSAEVNASTLLGAFSISKPNNAGVRTVVIAVPKETGMKAYSITIPENFIAAGNNTKKIEISTAIASIKLPSDMFKLNHFSETKNVTLSIAKVDKTKFKASLQKLVGNRPVIELGVIINDKMISYNNPSVPVEISIPYTPSEQELAHLNNLRVCFIDGKGRLILSSAAHYDSKRKQLTFITTHLGTYEYFIL